MFLLAKAAKAQDDVAMREILALLPRQCAHDPVSRNHQNGHERTRGKIGYRSLPVVFSLAYLR
jgi:hypothetical protein